MPTKQGSKPTVKVTTPNKRKETRAQSWKLGQERKVARKAANEAAHRANRERVARGELTPHEQALVKAKARGDKVLVDPETVMISPTNRRGYHYNPAAEMPDTKGNESTYEREQREKFWRAFGALIRSGVISPKMEKTWSR